jgi:hypothetical protein
MNQQNNFNLNAIGRDWYSGVGAELDSTWGQLPQFKGDILQMKFCFAQVCWLDSDLYALQSRRQCVYAFGEKIFDNPNNSPRFHDWWNFFGIESNSGKLADAVCTLYNDAPYREFTEGLIFKNEDSQADMQEALTELYEEYNVNLAFKTAYRYAYFVNCVVLMPDFENKTIQVLTPDMFRFLGPELWYIKLAYDDKGNQIIQYHVWDSEQHRVVDATGKQVSTEPNPYGRVPATILKLNQTTELYGSGVSEAAEINVWQNMINYFTTKIGVNQSHSILAAFNIPTDQIKNQYLGAGAVLVLEGTKIEGLDPKLEYITPQNFTDKLEEQKQKRVRQFERDQGLPGFLVDEGAGQPPTGAALQVMERGLNEKRKEHRYALVKCEKDFADLMARGTNYHDNTRSLAVGKIAVQYADVETFNDPKAEADHDKDLAAQGFRSPSQLWQKYTGERLTDEEADKKMKDNKAFFTTSELRSTVGGAQAILTAQIAYQAGQITQEQGISLAVNVYQYPQDIALSMFPAKLPLAA